MAIGPKKCTYTGRRPSRISHKIKLGRQLLSSRLCLPDPLDAFRQTNVVRLKLVQANRGGEGEDAQEPVQELPELGHALRTEVVDDRGPAIVNNCLGLMRSGSKSTYWKPTCEWTTRVAQRIASVTGLREPAANGAMVKGIRPAATILLK